MSALKAGKPDRGAPIEEPQVLHDALQILFEAESEFFIKVEGTATLPYAARVQGLRFQEEQFSLRLVRPLPHEMLPGAQFRMTFAVEEQRFEAVIGLLGRDGYLQYGFQLPTCLFQADRRRHKRYPFRPRENAYATAQDGGLPGFAVAGPLMNISMGGLALRVDRALRMDDGGRVPVHSALFERGKGFPRFRIQDLPQLALLEGRSISAHASEHGSELILGLTFTGLDLEQETALARALEFRERMHLGGAPGRASSHGPGAAGVAPGAEAPPARPEAPPAVPVTVLLRLQRRATRVVLVMAEGAPRQRIQELLRGRGYQRLEAVADLEMLAPLCAPGQRRAQPGLVLVDLALARSGDAEPLAAARIIEARLAELGGPVTAILCEEIDPTLLLIQDGPSLFLAYPGEAPEDWIAALDTRLGAS